MQCHYVIKSYKKPVRNNTFQFRASGKRMGKILHYLTAFYVHVTS